MTATDQPDGLTGQQQAMLTALRTLDHPAGPVELSVILSDGGPARFPVDDVHQLAAALINRKLVIVHIPASIPANVKKILTYEAIGTGGQQ